MTNGQQGLRIGVDIGGTFTDLVFLHADGRLDKRKVPTTPSDYSQGIIGGIEAYFAEEGLSGGGIAEVVHATTVATNAILERTGSPTALVTTDGFRDVLELRRIRIPLSYDLGWEKPVPLVEREFRFGARERVDADGSVLVPFDPASLEPVIEAVRANDIEAVAVCFLHAYRNPAHERAAGEILRSRLPDRVVCLSSEVLPEMLEFERSSTTVVNAYIAPLISRYLARLRGRISESGVKAPILVMQSNGGLVSAGTAAHRPVSIIESGPAAGVVAAAALARKSGHQNVIALDMGGTTTKASIVENGVILRGQEYEVGSAVSSSSRLVRGNGYLLRIPVIDISEVGAGGGSIAGLDPGGALRVGPRSAGAVPGPACYGNGNDQPTVTDANLVLGYLHPTSLAGGALTVERDLAVEAIRRSVAEPGGLDLMEAAHGIHLVANSNMVRAIKSVTVERGRDPADFAVMAFGGAGPIHAVGVAAALGIRRVIVPPAPGVFSAFGLLGAEVEHHTARTILMPVTEDSVPALADAVAEMTADIVGRIREEGYEASAISVTGAVDLRYRGQSSELTVPFDLDRIDAGELGNAIDRFEAEFERTYGHRGEQKRFELVTVRLVGTVRRGGGLRDAAFAETGAGTTSHDEREVYFGRDAGAYRVPVVRRGQLGSSERRGPLIVQEYDTTIVVPPGWSVRHDEHDCVVVELGRDP